MATDLSKLIQDGLGSTLTALLGKDSKFNETTKVDRRDLGNFEFLQVNAEFAFDKLSTLFEFFIPAASASTIFNIMMSADDYDVDLTIDDDTADAMSEFVSNLSGGLVTAFNAEQIEELGKVKFNIQHKQLLQSEDIKDIDTIYRFSIDVDETPILLFIRFHEEILPFVPNIASSEVTYYPPEPVKREKKEELENTPEVDNNATSTESEELINTESLNVNVSKLQKLMTKKNKIILGSILLIIILLIVFISLGSSDPEEEISPQEVNATKEEPKEMNQTQEVTTTPYKTLKKIDFSINTINVPRLSTRLETLTKFQILSEAEIEQYKMNERIRLLQLEREKELLEFAKKNKEEPITLQIEPEQNETQEISSETSVKEDETSKLAEEQQNDTSQVIIVEEPQNMQNYYLSTYNVKYKLFKELIIEHNYTSTRISLCNDRDGRTAIFLGPFENDIEQMKMKTLIEKADPSISTTLLSMTKELFDQKCNF